MPQDPQPPLATPPPPPPHPRHDYTAFGAANFLPHVAHTFKILRYAPARSNLTLLGGWALRGGSTVFAYQLSVNFYPGF